MRSLLSLSLCLTLLDLCSAAPGDLLQRLAGVEEVPCITNHVDIIVAGYNNNLGLYSITDQEAVKLECNYRWEENHHW